MTSCLSQQRDARGIVRLTLQRPQQHNAFNDVLAGELRATLAALAVADGVRAVILSGAGPTFCAGADLAYMQLLAAADEARNFTDALSFAEMFRALELFPKPTIARVNGNAFGGGVGLIACCDIAIGIDSAQFALTEVRVGLVPATISPHVIRAIGARFARRWFLTGERLDAARAAQIGLLHEVVATAELDARVEYIVAELLKGGPEAQREAKELVREAAQPLDASLLRSTAMRLARLRVSAEGREGIAAFLERRRPSW